MDESRQETGPQRRPRGEETERSTDLEQHLAAHLKERASTVQFTPEMRKKIMSRISVSPQKAPGQHKKKKE